MTLIKEMEEKIDERDLLSTVGKNSIYALFLSGLLVGGAYCLVTYVFPWLFGAGEAISIVSWLSMVLTIAVFTYVFRNEYLPDVVVNKDGDQIKNYTKWEKTFSFIKWAAIAVLYSVAMYFGGEIIVVALLVLGIALTSLFMFSQGSITFLLTWREIKNKIKAINERQQKEQLKKLLNPEEF